MRVRKERPQVYGQSGVVVLSRAWTSLTFALRPGRAARSTSLPLQSCGTAAGEAWCETTAKLPLAAWSPGSSYSNSIRAEHRPKQGAAIQAPMSNLFTCAARGRRSHRACSRDCPIAAGNPATIPAKMSREMPLPTPRSVICSPSHIMNTAPVTSDATAVT